MRYQEFLCAVESELNKKLKEGVKASVYISEKNNNSEKAGILLKTRGLNAAPVIYLEEPFSRVMQGEKLERVVREILAFYREAIEEKVWDCRQFEKYEDIKDKIVFKLINTERNTRFLKSVPSINVLDLSIVFYIFLESERTSTASIQINNEHLKMWGVGKEELYHAAMKNAANLLSAEFFTMRYAIEEMLHVGDNQGENLLKGTSDREDIMYVLTNTLRNYGAVCMIYPHMAEKIGDLLQEDYYILPSSVHEVIIVPDSRSMRPEEMSQMVSEINENQVSPDEVLSDHAYFYQRQGRKLLLEKKTDGR